MQGVGHDVGRQVAGGIKELVADVEVARLLAVVELARRSDEQWREPELWDNRLPALETVFAALGRDCSDPIGGLV